MPKKRYYDGYYESMDSRRAQERKDGSMISKDMSAQANMPQGVIMRLYPGEKGGLGESLDDTMRGIDSQVSSDVKKMYSGKATRKY